MTWAVAWLRTAATAVALAALPALVLAALPVSAASATGGDYQRNLHIEGTPGWRATNLFRLAWEAPPQDAAVFRFLNVPWAPQTHIVAGVRSLELAIPPPPGASEPPPGEYWVETRLLDPAREAGPPSFVALRFDDATPPPAQPTVPPGWRDGRSPTTVTIERPAPPPLSGIRGYAVIVGGHPGESPCASPARCRDGEIDVTAGTGDGKLRLGALPGGVHYLTAVAVSGTGIASPPRSVAIPVDATPPTIRFAGVPAGWVDHPVAVTAISEDQASGTAPDGASGPLTAIAVDGGPAALAFGGSVAATVVGEGAHAVGAWGRDAVGNAVPPAATPAATVRIDETPPRVAFAAAQRPGDPELIEATVADALSGADPSRGSIEVRRAGSGRRFEPLPTQAGAGVLSARWSSDDYPTGSYEFRATGFDAAGNATVTTRRADGTPMVLHNPLKKRTAIDSGFGGARLVWQHCHRVAGGRRCHREAVTDFESRPAVRTVPYGRPLRFGGVLHTAGGQPLGGRRVVVVETFAPGADAAQRRTTAITAADGGFRARLAPGPTRRVEAFFPGTRTLTRSSGRSVTMAIRAGLRLRASTRTARIGGRPVVFRGRLLAGEAAIPRTGRPVQLEFRVPGGAWSEFRTVQTNRRGRFRYPYSFTDDDSHGVRFQFRAVSPEQADWPYRPGSSRPVPVTGY